VNNMKKLTLGMTMLLCGSSVAWAQTLNDSWYVAPSVNYMKPDSSFGVNKKDFGAGVRFGKALGPNLDIQLGPTYARVKDNGVRYQQYLFGVDGLYMFSRSSLRPFVLGGVGAEYDKKDAPGVNTSKTSPFLDAGFGLQYAFNEKMALQADYRRVFGFVSSNDFGFKRPKNDYVNLGLNISFGGH
jgi:OOP family OmpA-OmpF porin